MGFCKSIPQSEVPSRRTQVFLLVLSFPMAGVFPVFTGLPVEDKMCSGNEREEIKPSTSNKGDSQVDGENNVTDATPKNS